LTYQSIPDDVEILASLSLKELSVFLLMLEKMEEAEVEHSKAVTVVSTLEDPIDEEPPTADEFSGCRDRWGSISRPDGLLQERILLRNRW